MKIRIKDDSIRLRLTKTEVDSLCSNSVEESKTVISQNVIFSYTIQANNSWSVSFTKQGIRIEIPSELIKNWNKSNKVGFETVLENGKEGLKLLIEKDFKCLTPRDENEDDHYENPLEKHNC